MFDTMTLTKTVGALCGALLIFLLGNWASETIYHGAGHGGDHEQAYVIDTGEAEEEVVEEEAAPDFAELYASADLDSGERVFNKCKACHVLEEGVNRVGPSLYGVVGRAVDAVGDYSYSGSLEAVAEVWTPEELNAFLEDPSGYAPGTTMGFAGLDKVEDRANVIAYLDQSDGDTYDMGAAEPAEEAATEETATEEAATEEAAAQEPATEEAATEEAATAEAAAQEPATEEAAAETAQTDPPATGEASGFAALVAAANPEDGKKVYNKCRSCHVADKEDNRVGPHLVGIVGRDVASAEGFAYSDAMVAVGGQWTIDRLNAWLEDPKGFAPGNKMSFAGVRKEEERASLIAYLQSLAN